MGPPNQVTRRFVLPVIVTLAVIVLLATTHFVAHNFTTPPLGLKTPISPTSPTSSTEPTEPKIIHDAATIEAERGQNQLGKVFHVNASPPGPAGIEGCEFPILIHVTPDEHCTGALALYGSIVRNTLMQPKELQNKTCVHFTYVDPTLRSIEAMYRWHARPNPFTIIADCAALDRSPALNAVVPVRWQALAPIDKPAQMRSQATWVVALNKVHSWGFDLYDRVLLLDADSMIVTDLHKIFQETPVDITIAAATDQWADCMDRSRLNGGMVLLRPSRYFHIVATELLYDEGSSCLTGSWGQSEQELLNCICGFSYNNEHAGHALRPEFRCAVMPTYNSVWPRNYGCSDANVLPMRSIHFTGAVLKPWYVAEERLDVRFDTKFWRCMRDAARAKNVGDLKECRVPALEVTRKVGREGIEMEGQAKEAKEKN